MEYLICPAQKKKRKILFKHLGVFSCAKKILSLLFCSRMTMYFKSSNFLSSALTQILIQLRFIKTQAGILPRCWCWCWYFFFFFTWLLYNTIQKNLGRYFKKEKVFVGALYSQSFHYLLCRKKLSMQSIVFSSKK
jgi:hypothetical protein